MATTTRFTIDVDDKFTKTLDRLVQDTSATTKAEVIRRAIATYDYLAQNAKDSRQVVIRDDNSKAETKVVIPT